jgi:hypothetical protein
MQRLQIKLLLRFLRNCFEIGPQSSLGDGFSIIVIVLLALIERLT